MNTTRKQKEKINISATELGRLGGRAIVKKIGKKGMSRLGKLAAKARWGK